METKLQMDVKVDESEDEVDGRRLWHANVNLSTANYSYSTANYSYHFCK